ncbi:hypothetical protein K1719_043496 [Acacia pycnantha]|nr:hypothetical protein K1719_043496 [Acacia pycnantha]
MTPITCGESRLGIETLARWRTMRGGYKNGKEFQDERVLVIGSGNSGMEIALDLVNFGARPSIIVRNPVHFLTRDMMHYASFLLKYLPPSTVENLLMILSRIVFGDLTKYGLPWPSEGPFTMKMKYGKFPIIDVGTIQKIKSGDIQVLGVEIERIRGNEVVLKDGKSFAFESIVFCTGFKRSTHKWVEGGDDLLDEEGLANSKFPKHWKGKNGLYCVGLAQRGFFGAGRDAENIADDIASLLQLTTDGKFGLCCFLPACLNPPGHS